VLVAAKVPTALPEASTNRVYDPVAQWPLNQVDLDSRRYRKFGGHTRGTTSDQNVINSGMAKNKIDINILRVKQYLRIKSVLLERENELWKR
jgi:hypothetical protein